jgi:hypothetical protein
MVPASGVDAGGRRGGGCVLWSIVISATLQEDVLREKILLRGVGEGDRGKHLYEQSGRNKKERK